MFRKKPKFQVIDTLDEDEEIRFVGKPSSDKTTTTVSGPQVGFQVRRNIAHPFDSEPILAQPIQTHLTTDIHRRPYMITPIATQPLQRDGISRQSGGQVAGAEDTDSHGRALPHQALAVGNAPPAHFAPGQIGIRPDALSRPRNVLERQRDEEVMFHAEFIREGAATIDGSDGKDDMHFVPGKPLNTIQRLQRDPELVQMQRGTKHMGEAMRNAAAMKVSGPLDCASLFDWKKQQEEKRKHKHGEKRTKKDEDETLSSTAFTTAATMSSAMTDPENPLQLPYYDYCGGDDVHALRALVMGTQRSANSSNNKNRSEYLRSLHVQPSFERPRMPKESTFGWDVDLVPDTKCKPRAPTVDPVVGGRKPTTSRKNSSRSPSRTKR